MTQQLPDIQPRKSTLKGLNLLQTAVPVYSRELLPTWTTKVFFNNPIIIRILIQKEMEEIGVV